MVERALRPAGLKLGGSRDRERAVCYQLATWVLLAGTNQSSQGLCWNGQVAPDTTSCAGPYMEP